MEQARAGALEAASLSGDGEVLAGESADEQINVLAGRPTEWSVSVPAIAVCSQRSRPSGSCAFVAFTNVSDVVIAGDAGESLGEDTAPPGVGLREEGVSHTGALQANVHPADAAERGASDHSEHRSGGVSPHEQTHAPPWPGSSTHTQWRHGERRFGVMPAAASAAFQLPR